MSAHGRQLHLKPPPATGKASHLAMQGDANGHRMRRPMVVTTLACGKMLKRAWLSGHTAALNRMERFIFPVKEEWESWTVRRKKNHKKTFRWALMRLKGPSRLQHWHRGSEWRRGECNTSLVPSGNKSYGTEGGRKKSWANDEVHSCRGGWGRGKEVMT